MSQMKLTSTHKLHGLNTCKEVLPQSESKATQKKLKP